MIRTAFFLLLSISALAGPLTNVSSPAGAKSGEPFLHATRHGILMSWLEPDDKSDRSTLLVARYKDGKWSEPRAVARGNEVLANRANFPSVVEDEKGVLYAQWLQKNGGSAHACDVYLAISSDDGRTWSKSFLLNRDGKAAEHGFVSMQPLSGGGVAIAWLDGRNTGGGPHHGGEMTLRYATVDARGKINSEEQLDGRTCECCNTGMTNAPTGSVIVYRDRSADEVRDIAAVRRTASGWSKPYLVHADGWKIAGCPVNGPRIDSMGRRAVVAWFTLAGDRPRVYAAFSDDGGATFAKPIVIDESAPMGRVDVVMLDGDSALVTWLVGGKGSAEVRARKVSRSGALEPSIRVAASSDARSTGFPRIAREGSDVYFAWTDPKGGVHVARSRF